MQAVSRRSDCRASSSQREHSWAAPRALDSDSHQPDAHPVPYRTPALHLSSALPDLRRGGDNALHVLRLLHVQRTVTLRLRLSRQSEAPARRRHVRNIIRPQDLPVMVPGQQQTQKPSSYLRRGRMRARRDSTRSTPRQTRRPDGPPAMSALPVRRSWREHFIRNREATRLVRHLRREQPSPLLPSVQQTLCLRQVRTELR